VIIADKMEKRDRIAYLISKRKIKMPSKKKIIPKAVYKKILKKYGNNNCEVWIVNGEFVRDFFFLDFTEGGHDRVYSFIPKNEIWIDDDLSRKELKYVLLHEVYERNLMVKGVNYNSAHKKALEIELKYRNNPKLLNFTLKDEFNKYLVR